MQKQHTQPLRLITIVSEAIDMSPQVPAKPREQSTNVKSPWLAAMFHGGWRCR
jgi:hypothetical protein